MTLKKARPEGVTPKNPTARRDPGAVSGPLQRAVTIEDVATAAGVAVSSVSRALTGHPDVSASMKERVNHAVRTLGYQADMLAVSFRSGSTRTIGFVVRDISNPIFAEIFKAAEHVLREAGYAIVLVNSDGDSAQEALHVRLLSRRRVDGLILSLVSEDNAETLAALETTRIPLVLLDREADLGRDVGAVLGDHYSGMSAAMRDLIDRGHRRIALITGPMSVRPTRERVRAFEQAQGEAGLTVSKELLGTGSFSEEVARAHTERMMRLPNPPTAIIAGGLQSTIGVLAVLAELNLRIGEDLALVVCDEIQLLRLFKPQISVVARNPAQIGRQAAEMILTIVGGGLGTEFVVPTEYIPRESTAKRFA